MRHAILCVSVSGRWPNFSALEAAATLEASFWYCLPRHSFSTIFSRSPISFTRASTWSLVSASPVFVVVVRFAWEIGEILVRDWWETHPPPLPPLPPNKKTTLACIVVWCCLVVCWCLVVCCGQIVCGCQVVWCCLVVTCCLVVACCWCCLLFVI